MNDRPKPRRFWLMVLLAGIGIPLLLVLATVRLNAKYNPMILVGYKNKDVTSVLTLQATRTTKSINSLSADFQFEPQYVFSILGVDIWQFRITDKSGTRTVTILNRGKESFFHKDGDVDYFISSQMPPGFSFPKSRPRSKAGSK